MGWNRFRKLAYAALCGGVVLQTAGCDTIVATIIANVASAVASEAILTGIPF